MGSNRLNFPHRDFRPTTPPVEEFQPNVRVARDPFGACLDRTWGLVRLLVCLHITTPEASAANRRIEGQINMQASTSDGNPPTGSC